MTRIALGLALLVAAALIQTGNAGAVSPTSPMLLSATPADGAKLTKAPSEVAFTFSEPLDGAYSRIEIYDACGRRVDSGSIAVTGTEMKTTVEKKPSGRYKVYYFANAIPKGATGETDGTTTFTSKKGPNCK
jgi:methionine-rich copper-binding protein CopC